MSVRPTRQRLASIFTGHWTQVRLAEQLDAGLRVLSPYKGRKVKGYQEDLHCFRLQDGSLKGHDRFRALAEHGAGVPFFLHGLFDGSAKPMLSLPSRAERPSRSASG